MKKNNKYLLIPLLSFLCLNNVYASCTQEEIDNFKKIQDEFTVTYELNQETKSYDLILTNPEPKKFDYNIQAEVEYGCKTKQNQTIIQCIGLPAGEYDIQIIGNTETCSTTMKKITVSLPKYNKFSEDTLCEGIEEFVLCQPDYGKNIDYETFVSRVNTYKNSKAKKESETVEEDNKKSNNETSMILEYIKNNLVQILIIIIFIILVVITTIITLKNIKKRRRLE